MIKLVNNVPHLIIPHFSFISVLSTPFFNRQAQLSYAVNSALLKRILTIDLAKVDLYFSSMVKPMDKCINFVFIVPDLKNDFIQNHDKNHGKKFGCIRFIYGDMNYFTKLVKSTEYLTNERYYFFFIGFDN